MRKLLLLVALAGFTYHLSAQVAIKAGVNFANMVFEDDENVIEDLTENGATGFTGGLAVILPLNDFIAIQPEFLFTQKGAERNYTLFGETITEKLTYNYIDVPLMLRLSLGGTYGEGLGLYINAGVYGGYVLNGKNVSTTPLGETERDIEFGDDSNEKRADFGLTGGVGITVGDLILEVRYLHGTNNLLDSDANNSNDDFDKLQHRGLALSAGWIF